MQGDKGRKIGLVNMESEDGEGEDGEHGKSLLSSSSLQGSPGR